MFFIFKFFTFFLLFCFIYHLLTRKYLNPYTLTMVVGKKGSGKSTLKTKLAIQHLKKGWNVYCQEPIPGCHLFSIEDFGNYAFPENSVLLIDEVGMIWDNRDYKSFKPVVRDWFKLQRHRKIKVYLFSQTFDIDKKLRDLTDDMYLVTCVGRVFTWAKRICRKPCLVTPSGDSPARLDDELYFESLLFWPLGSRHLTFIPAWTKFFDTREAPALYDREWPLVPDPDLLLPRSLQPKGCRRSLVSSIRLPSSLRRMLLSLHGLLARLLAAIRQFMRCCFVRVRDWFYAVCDRL